MTVNQKFLLSIIYSQRGHLRNEFSISDQSEPFDFSRNDGLISDVSEKSKSSDILWSRDNLGFKRLSWNYLVYIRNKIIVLTIYWNRFLVVLNHFLRDLFLKRKNLVKRARFHKSMLIYFQNIFFLHEVSLMTPWE